MNDGGICPSTRGQIGWRATRNGMPDVVDTTPTVTLKPPSLDGVDSDGRRRRRARTPGRPATTPRVTPSSTASASSCRTTCGTASTAAPGTRSALPDNGASEGFSFTTAALGPGRRPAAPTRHVVTVQRHDRHRRRGERRRLERSHAGDSRPVEQRRHHPAGRQGQADRARLGRGAIRSRHTPSASCPASRSERPGGAQQDGHDRRRRGVPWSPSRRASRRGSRPRSTPVAPSPFQAADVGPVSVAVRALLTAHAGAPSAARVVRVTGTLPAGARRRAARLAAAGGGAWKTVARTHTTARSTFSLVYTRARGHGAPARALRRRRQERRRRQGAAGAACPEVRRERPPGATSLPRAPASRRGYSPEIDQVGAVSKRK